MATNQNVHVNTFSGGMNTDTSYINMKNEQYTMAINTRVSTVKYDNTTFDETYSNQKENVLAPVQVGENQYCLTADPIDQIKDYLSIKENYIYKILTSGDTNVILYKNYIDEGNDKGKPILIVGLLTTDTDNKKQIEILFYTKLPKDLKNISAVLNTEQEDVINLYIATEETKLLCINVADKEYIKNIRETNSLCIDIDNIASNSFFPYDKLIIADKINGNLKTQQVQYTYRFYKKHGIVSKLAPLTNKIQVINSNKTKDTGCSEDTNTNVGFKLNIKQDILNKAAILFDRIQIYRISYIKANKDAEITLCFDGKFNEKSFVYDDVKNEGIQSLSLDEFSSLSGLAIEPKVIESNQNYLFCGDIKDTTIIEISNNDIIEGYKTKRYNFNGNWNSDLDSQYSNINNSSLINTETCCLTAPSDKNTSSPSQYLGGTGGCIEYKFVLIPIPSCSVNESLNINTNVEQITPHTSFYIKKNNTGLLSYELNNINDTYLDNKYINIKNTKGGFDNIAVSSMMKSLKRDEVYRYGIVFYNKYGNRTNVLYIGDIKTPSIFDTFGDVYYNEDSIGTISGLTYKQKKSNNIFSLQLGLEFTVKIHDKLKNYNIVGYEIVRCEKNNSNTRNLYQVVLSKPVRQTLSDGTFSPYYPTGFISTQPMRIAEWINRVNYLKQSRDAITQDLKYKEDENGSSDGVYLNKSAQKKQLFQCFCPEYYIYNKDVINDIKNSDCNILTQCYVNGGNVGIVSSLVDCKKHINAETSEMNDDDKDYIDPKNVNYSKYGALSGYYQHRVYDVISPERYKILEQSNVYITINKNVFDLNKKYKSSIDFTIPLCESYKLLTKIVNNDYQSVITSTGKYKIQSVTDSKNALWSDGFANYNKSGVIMISATKKYKTYVTSISEYSYLNWICSGKYDYPVSASKDSERDYGFTGVYWGIVGEFTNTNVNDKDNTNRRLSARGAIGPGGPCFLAVLEDARKEVPLGGITLDDYFLLNQNTASENNNVPFGTLLCNIQHTAKQFSGTTEEEHQYDIYYGFGNYVYVGEGGGISKNVVFDGDTYVDVQELYGQFKAYDFNDFRNSLQSAQIIYYIPMESKINWRFDYGHNKRNTSSKNLQLEPGEITGITTQERPIRQYNSIYSDNNTSCSMFNAQPLDKSINVYNQRIFYSNLKTNGENIDSWQIFKPINFIDCNSKFGPITDLYTFKDTLYMWQKNAIAKLSVNERSLISDKNSNVIQLGQGDVLQRVDYISTNYGMRQYDMCKVNTENGLFWFDYYNKCIAAFAENSVIDYTDTKNVKSIMYNYKDDRNPSLVYDQKHKELLFGDISSPIDDNVAALVFNIKYNIPVGLYYLKFSNILQYDKDCISIDKTIDIKNNPQPGHNCIHSYGCNGNLVYLSPTYIQFVVNNNPSITKTFDNQQIVTNKRNVNYEYNPSVGQESYFNLKELKISTDLCDVEINDSSELETTDREGNIKYALPRYNTDEGYGNRIKGKYMLESIKDNNPDKDSTISHILTKYRISYN